MLTVAFYGEHQASDRFRGIRQRRHSRRGALTGMMSSKAPIAAETRVTVGKSGGLTAVLTHAEVGHAAVSQDHDEFGLVGPPLLFSGCV